MQLIGLTRHCSQLQQHFCCVAAFIVKAAVHNATDSGWISIGGSRNVVSDAACSSSEGEKLSARLVTHGRQALVLHHLTFERQKTNAQKHGFPVIIMDVPRCALDHKGGSSGRFVPFAGFLPTTT